MSLNDYVPFITLFLGGGAGIAGIKTFFWLGKKAEQLETREKSLVKIEKTLEDRQEIDEAVRTLVRDVGSLQSAASKLAEARIKERDEAADAAKDLVRSEERFSARLQDVEKGLSRMQRFFSSQYPRVQLTSSPDLSDHDKEK